MKDSYSSFRSFMDKNCKEVLTLENLKKATDEAYTKQVREEARLLELYNQKKLTNKDTIRKARAVAQRYKNK